MEENDQQEIEPKFAADKFLLLKSHPASKGLPDTTLQEIADACELLEFDTGALIHDSSEVISKIDLVIIGRMRLELIDIHGQVQVKRYITRGGQYGGLSAALSEPAPIRCIAEDPTKILQLDYEVGLKFTRKHDGFRTNMLRLLADGVKRTLFHDKTPVRPGLVGIFHQTPDTRILSRRILRRLVDLGESPCLMIDHDKWEPMEGVSHRRIYLEGGKLDDEKLKEQLKEWADYERIIADVSTSLDEKRSQRILRAADIVLWCITPKNWRESIPLLKKFRTLAPGWKDKICVVWLMGNEVIAPVADELLPLVKRDIKVSFQEPGENQGPSLKHGFERIIHLLRGVQIGVALGGGAARGMAHLGVLKALENSGIVVDMIAGTSAGAMTGTVYSAGLDVDYSIGCFVKDLRPTWLFRHIPKGDQWYLLYKYRRGHFDPMLRTYLQDYRLEQLPVAMNSITVDLISGKVVVRDIGDAVHGIVESINLPVLSVPVIRQGQALVDGGMINNVPADVLVSKGCNFVIAVSVTAKMETEFARNRPDTPAEEMKAPSTLQTILRTYLVQSASVNALGVQPADIVIEPDVTGFELTDFVRTDELAAVGEQATFDSVAKIKQQLSHLDPKLFPAA